MVEEPPGCGHQEINPFAQFLCLHLEVGPAHHDAVGVVLVGEEISDHSVSLQ